MGELGQNAVSILQMLHGRQMFIGDELRLSSLRVAWEESGHSGADFNTGLGELIRAGHVRQVKSASGAALQLTQSGYQQMLKPPPAKPAMPQVAESSRPTRRPVSPRAPQLRSAGPGPSQATPLPPPSPPETARGPVRLTQPDRQDVIHARVFRTQIDGINDNVLVQCLLGLLDMHKLGPRDAIELRIIVDEWAQMGLSRADLLYTLDMLVRDNAIGTISEPHERVMLKERGRRRLKAAPRNLEEGKDRWNARKRLIAIRKLGRLPAA